MSMHGQTQAQVPAIARQFTDQQMKNYFAEIPGAAIKAIIAGAIIFFIGLLAQAAVILVIGLIVAAIGAGIIAMVKSASKPTDQEYDQWLEEQFQIVMNRALPKLSLDQSQLKLIQNPLTIQSFMLSARDTQRYPADQVRYKFGSDGKPRFSINIFTIFFPVEHHLAVFISTINALNQSAHNEQTAEYFYEDIVGATTDDDQQDFVTIKGKVRQYRMQHFTLKINSGDSIGATVAATPIDTKQNLPTFSLPDRGMDQTVKQLRALLRTKKQRTVKE